MEKVKQQDRESAAAQIKGDNPKAQRVRTLILAGEADDHPSVQGAAFYRKQSE